MSEQTSTTTNAGSEPRLCKMGCGFFGSEATGNCCSKCYTAMIKQQQKDRGENETSTTQEATALPTSTCMEVCMEVDVPAPTLEPAEIKPTATDTVSPAPEKATKKKKKKKTSYKDMMASMTKRTKDENDIQKEKEGLRKVTGGGTFSKIDKI